jgi:acyl-CoA dehydrogenase
LECTELHKTGWWCSDTATLTFDDCHVPTTHVLGRENEGFMGVMRNFNCERIMLAAQAIYFSDLLIEEASSWAQQRKTFGHHVGGTIAMLKNMATDCMQLCADGAVQVLGGAGYVRGHSVERLYREVKVMQIGGGSTEIMKDLAAKQMGLMDRR